MTDKLSVLVRVDLDCAHARIAAQGRVTVQSIQALYVVVKRANALSEWVHPRFERWITVREAARLQSFHDGFVFHPSEWQMLKQIGNAVPPLLARAVAASALKALEVLDSDKDGFVSVPESEWLEPVALSA